MLCSTHARESNTRVMSKFRVACSISDFSPVLSHLESAFRLVAEWNVDGVELVVGFKSRWSGAAVRGISRRYDLPIAALHQPVWAGLGLYFDEGFVRLAEQVEAASIVVHPLPGYAFSAAPMQRYLERLARVQEKYHVRILLENLPRRYYNPVVQRIFGQEPGTPAEVAAAARSYGLGMTLDTSHAMLTAPHREDWFKTVLRQTSNIHLSSFSWKRTHLPLGQGALDSAGLLRALTMQNYCGMVTLEVYHPRMVNVFRWDPRPLRNSVAVIRETERSLSQAAA